MNYTESLFNYKRRETSTTTIGNITMGSQTVIRIQSMANTNTNDISTSVEQCVRIIEAGADLVRFTTQGTREAENLGVINKQLKQQNTTAPLVADVHFNPNVADIAAQKVEKVRINPGNYVDNIHTFQHFEYTDEEYATEIEKIRQRFIPFLNICKANNTAIRIGVNHGSLSDRIMSRYGDTAQGMVESCMEFLRICCEEEFYNVVISIKSSNTLAMVQTVRLLVATMQKENMKFPLHIGVTEAGDGEDGRIKSAVGIGTLLLDGIGDTLRVSLTEAPENEIPVAKKLVALLTERQAEPNIAEQVNEKFSPYEYARRITYNIKNIGSEHVPIVVADVSNKENLTAIEADFIYSGNKFFETKLPQIVDESIFDNQPNTFALYENINSLKKTRIDNICFLKLKYSQLTQNTVNELKTHKNCVIWHPFESIAESRAFFHRLLNEKCNNPVVLVYQRNDIDSENFQLAASMFAGSFFLDGFSDGLMLQNEYLTTDELVKNTFGILQATRTRFSKTEYISCPGCGRTMFDLQNTLAKVKAATSHLKNLKIAVMGCIVNGTGEMADADYGYVGAGKGKVSLYKQKQCIEKNIPEQEAIARLEALIRANGDWETK
jgi:(E)-4-hydroxy-3-methylbut-2-enyl-diphosphate synthase